MQAATHLAGGLCALALARGFGLEVGPWEVGAALLGSLLPDVDTTTAGAGRYVRPLAAWIETRFGHRTITHGLLFAAACTLLCWPLGPSVALALLYGVLSHLLLDTMNVNGVPLLWPWRLQFWFLPNRSSRIRYGSPQETTLAASVAVAGVLLWPISGDTFGTAARRLVATPETAVTDYVRWRDTRAVFVTLDGFNSDTQERIRGRFRVVEALGRSGVLIEDDAGHALQVSRNGQVVAYRVRAYPGEERPTLDTRVSVGGRLLSDVVDAVPAGARAYFTGELELSAPVRVPPVAAGTFARVSGTERLTLHAARPADLAQFAGAYVVAGSLVVRLEGRSAGAGLGFHMPAQTARMEARTISLDDLPAPSAVLVERGALVAQGQPLARYVRTADLAELDDDAHTKRQALARARAALKSARAVYQTKRDALSTQLQPAQREAATLRSLYALGAEPRVKVEEAEARARALSDQLVTLSAEYAADEAQARADVDALALEVQQLTEKRERLTRAEVVRSPLSGRVAEVRVKDANADGVRVELVIITEVKNEKS